MNNWYDDRNRSDWYKPLHYDPDSEWRTYPGSNSSTASGTDARGNGRSSNGKAGGTSGKKRGVRVAGGIILFAVLSLAAVFGRYGFPDVSFHVFSSSNNRSGTDDNGNDSGFGSYDFDYDPSEEIPADYPDDFKEYFESFFTKTESSETDIRINKAEEDQIPQFALALAGAPEMTLSLKEIYEKCADSIVSIKGYIDDEAGYNWGTGVVLSADGLILTNTHVIDGCDSAEVITTDGEVWTAELVGADSISDLAVLSVSATGLHPAEFGESSALSVGDPVAAIGNPLGDTFSGTLTDGIISAIERNISYNGRNMTLLQTNTALNEGNSGGALFNMYGQVIGITNMKMMSSYSSIEGIGFAIPSSTVKTVVNSLIECGEVRGRPSIGITVGAIPSNVSEHYEMPEGLYISAVSEGSDAEKQGVLAGDILTAVDGIPVISSEEVVEMKDKKSVGDTMTFSIWRNGEELEITVSLMDTNDIYG